jgi:hypothetical protein
MDDWKGGNWVILFFRLPRGPPRPTAPPKVRGLIPTTRPAVSLSNGARRPLPDSSL